MKGQGDLLLCLMTDLKSRGFFPRSRDQPDGFPQTPGITNIGVQFLQFILTSPA